ncbi:hypothetical protein BDN70DRAFT_769196, partial [Pholiota conissans]
TASISLECTFCGLKGHIQETCHCFLKSQKLAQENVQNTQNERSKHRQGQKANKAEESKEPSPEFAGHASALSTIDPTTLQSDADFDWLADTGATSHMTSHRSWIRNYTLHCIPIRLADHTIVYSAGIRTVVINPVIGGKDLRAVELSRVLHVPQL